MGNALKLTAPTAELPNGLLIRSGYDHTADPAYFAHRANTYFSLKTLHCIMATWATSRGAERSRLGPHQIANVTQPWEVYRCAANAHPAFFSSPDDP
jgi:hypothetical protein